MTRAELEKLETAAGAMGLTTAYGGWDREMDSYYIAIWLPEGMRTFEEYSVWQEYRQKFWALEKAKQDVQDDARMWREEAGEEEADEASFFNDAFIKQLWAYSDEQLKMLAAVITHILEKRMVTGLVARLDAEAARRKKEEEKNNGIS
jgi:hypothetical protein